MASPSTTGPILSPDEMRAIRNFQNPPTHIDRRTCRRVVPLQILVLGQSRTGTQSLRAALFDLGYADIYHMTSVFVQNPRDSEMWIRAFEGKFEGRGPKFGRAEWDQLLGHCMVVSDSPCVSFSEDLIAAYPDAKVILTVRDSADAWLKSCMQTIWPVVQEQYLSTWRRLILPKPFFRDLLDKVYGHSMYGTLPVDGKEQYLEYNEMIRKMVPRERLLEYNVKQGWEPLCKFLGKEVPKEDFPHWNDAATFNAGMDRMRKLQYQQFRARVAKSVAVVLGVALAWYAARRLKK